jgi:hypothetical protein
MSAPPIGMINSTPKTSESRITSGNRYGVLGLATSQRPAATAIASSRRFTKFCPRYVIGRVGMTSWSFPAAIRLPVQVR